MRAQTRKNESLDVRKIMRDLEEYEKSPARGGLRITMPVEQAVKGLVKVKPVSSAKRANRAASSESDSGDR